MQQFVEFHWLTLLTWTCYLLGFRVKPDPIRNGKRRFLLGCFGLLLDCFGCASRLFGLLLDCFGCVSRLLGLLPECFACMSRLFGLLLDCFARVSRLLGLLLELRLHKQYKQYNKQYKPYKQHKQFKNQSNNNQKSTKYQTKINLKVVAKRLPKQVGNRSISDQKSIKRLFQNRSQTASQSRSEIE